MTKLGHFTGVLREDIQNNFDLSSNFGVARNDRWLFEPIGWRDAWDAAKVASSTAPTWLSVIGHSIPGGGNSSNFLTLSYPSLVGVGLQAAGYVRYADFYHIGLNNVNMGTGNGTPPFTLTGTFSDSPNGYGLTKLWTGSPTNPIVFSGPSPGIQSEFLYYDLGGVSYTRKFDSDSNQVVNFLGDGFQKKDTSGVRSLATRTITIVSQSADQVTVPLGASVYYGSTGIGIGRMAYGGAALMDWARTDLAPADKMLFFQGKYLSGATGFGFPTQPALAIIQIDGNDFANPGTIVTGPFWGASPNAFKYGLVRMVQALRRGYANCSILFILTNIPDGLSSDMRIENTLASAWNLDVYHQLTRDVASSYNCAWISFQAKWGETGVAQGFQSQVAGGFHPTDAGHADIASAILGAIL